MNALAEVRVPLGSPTEGSGFSGLNRTDAKTSLPTLGQLVRESGKRTVLSDTPLIVQGIRGKTCYNVAAVVDGEEIKVLGRVEDAISESAFVSSFDFREARPEGLVVSRNGITIPWAQDPSPGQINGELTLNFVSAPPDPDNPGSYIPSNRTVHMSHRKGVDWQRGYAESEKHEKDVRIKDISFKHVLIVARQRLAMGDPRSPGGEIVDSYLQVGVAPRPKNLMELNGHIRRVRQDPNSRIELIQRDGSTWFGPNDIVPLLKKGRYAQYANNPRYAAAGIIYHAGQYENWLHANGNWERPYVTASSEILIDLEAGRSIEEYDTKVIATVDMLQRPLDQKRDDLGWVLFGGNVLVEIDSSGNVSQTYLAYGANDVAGGFLGIDYPFSAPPDPELNKFTVVREGGLSRFLGLKNAA